MLNEEYIDEIQEDDDVNGRYEHFRFTADPGQSLVRIDKFLTDRILNVSRTRMQAAADAGNL